MTEIINGKIQKGLGFHKLYTYVYLPLSIVMGLIISLGRFYHLATYSFDTFKSGIEFLHDIYPFVVAVLSLVALPLLIGKSSAGRRVVLFSETFKSLLALVLIAAYLSYGNILPAFVYTLLVFAMALVYGYYRVREWEFSGIEERIEEEKDDPISSPEKEEEPEVKEEETTIIQEEKHEEAESEPKVEEKEVVLEEVSNYEEKDIVKITSFIPSTFLPSSPLVVESITLKTLPDSSVMEIRVRNKSSLSFSSSLWSLDNGKAFLSKKAIGPFEETIIKALVNIPTDRLGIKLDSLEEVNGKRFEFDNTKFDILPERIEISSISKDDRFPFFLSSFLKEKEVNAKWLYTENQVSSSWICPQCGIPLTEEEKKCSICSLERDKAREFSSSLILSAFCKVKESQDK